MTNHRNFSVGVLFTEGKGVVQAIGQPEVLKLGQLACQEEPLFASVSDKQRRTWPAVVKWEEGSKNGGQVE